MRYYLNRFLILNTAIGVIAALIWIGQKSCNNRFTNHEKGTKTLASSWSPKINFEATDRNHTSIELKREVPRQAASYQYNLELTRHKSGDQTHELREIMGLWLNENHLSAVEYIATEARDAEFEWIQPAVIIYLNNSTGYPSKTQVVDRLYGDARIKENLLAAALRSWAHDDSISALNWLSANAHRFNDRAGAEAVGGHLGERENPKELLNTLDLDSVPLHVKEPFLCELVNRWSTYDLVESAEWLSRNHVKAGLDTVILSLVRNANRRSSSFAMAWAESITDEALRSEAITMTAEHWRQDDAGSFSIWQNQASHAALFPGNN